MSGFSVRLALWLKLWIRSLPAGVMMALLPATAWFIYMALPYRHAMLSSLFYEKTALLLYVFILQWCFSVDFDSKFYGQLLTYPIARWKLVAERALQRRCSLPGCCAWLRSG